MTGLAFDTLLTFLLLAGFALFGLAMLGVALRYGPRRGYWNQPAAMLRRPGRRVLVAMYGFAIVHVVIGLGLAVKFPDGDGIGMLVVLAATGTFYVLCAHSWTLAHSVARRRS